MDRLCLCLVTQVVRQSEDYLLQYDLSPPRPSHITIVHGGEKRKRITKRVLKLRLFYFKGGGSMIINDYDYFVNGVLKSSDASVKRIVKNIPNFYSQYEIPKKEGTRTISAIKKDSELYVLQKNLCKYFLDDVLLPTPAVGFVKNESYISYLSPHVGKRFFLRIDIKDFFGSISKAVIRKTFAEFFSSDDKEALNTFAQLCTLDDSLPQGAITSPVISNIAFRFVDQRILKYCQSFDDIYENNRIKKESISYTRYADDLLFSSDRINFSKKPYFIGMIISILKDSGYQANKNKTRCTIHNISLSGFVVGEDIHLSRHKLHELNKILYFFGKTQTHTHKKYRVNRQILTTSDWLDKVNQLKLKGSHGEDRFFTGVEDFLNYLCGYRSFLISVIRGNRDDSEHTIQLQKKVKKLEEIIQAILDH